MVILAIDPGSKKCGVAVVSSEQGILWHSCQPIESLGSLCLELTKEYDIDHIIVGGSTGSKVAKQIISDCLGCTVSIVDESHTTERAKIRYLKENPPRGWKKFVPQGLLYPPVPFDDYAAVVMAEDFIIKTQSS